MSKLAIVWVAASALMLAPGAAGAASWGGDQVAAKDDRPAASVDLSAQSKRARRSAPRRAPAPAARTPYQAPPAGMRMGMDPDPRIELEILRNRGHGD